MRILVTGGAGFIGSNVVDGYIETGYSVCVVDNLSKGRRKNIHPKARFYEVDILNRHALEEVFIKERPEVVNHHSAQVDVRRSLSEPLFDMSLNIEGSLNLLELSVKYGVKRFIYASSGGAIYGEPRFLPLTEEHPIEPISHYGVSKHTVEHYVELYRHNYGLNYVVLRYSNVYGPRQDPYGEAGVVAIFANLMLKGETPVIFGDGGQTRDFIYVKDVVDANIAALNKGTNLCLNIGSGKETSVREVFESIAQIVGFKGSPKFQPARKGEVSRIYHDVSRASSALKWTPKTPFKEGLRRAVEQIKKEVLV
ncbi:MAG: NAD-dependent epimerase/dehydratase family protein [Planctomycetota bacterium]|nr:NAD-dependent epimerase/dehydratase family protein [Planctomycetota bacterium]